MTLDGNEHRAADEARFAGFAIWAAATSEREDAALAGPARSVAEGAVVTLDEVTEATVRTICRLVVAPEQALFVAPNAISFAQALFTPMAWFRAVAADGVPVGFVMLGEDQETGTPELWRFMIDGRHQRKGYGREAIRLVLEHARSLPGATELRTSWFSTPGGPGPFYEGLGFVPTGQVVEGEVLASIALDRT